jgi:UDP-glucose 4-epimerase
MRVLCTGAMGFIGSHLTGALLERGDSVTALDDLSTGRESNLAAYLTHPGLRFVQGSVQDEALVGGLASGCDTIVHLAAAVGVKLVTEQPLRSFTANLRGTEVIFGAADCYGCRLMLASSSEIYGKTPGPLREDSDRVLGSPSVSRWAYSTAKGVDEVLAAAYFRERGLRTVVVRLFNVAGPRQSGEWGMVIPRLVRQALRGEPVMVYGDGRQARCFTHVADTVEAMLGLLDAAAAGEAFNVGSAEEISIADLARLVVAECGSSSPVAFVPYEQAYAPGFEDVGRRVPDCGKLRSLTGWVPRRTLADILRDVVAEARVTVP